MKLYEIEIDGNKIAELRGDSVRQIDLAHEIGTVEQNLNNWEHNERSVPGNYFVRICKYFNKPWEYFIKGE